MKMKKIKDDELLPKHTKYDYYECLAKIVLEETFPDEFSNLLLRDKPDIQDIKNSVGIEVTKAETRESEEAESLYSRLPFVASSNREKIIERIEQLGSNYNNGVLSESGYDDFNLINNAINRKIQTLLKGEYRKLNQYRLFVFSSIYASDEMMQDELDYLKENNTVQLLKMIYVYTPGYLYRLDLIHQAYDILIIGEKTQFDRSNAARQMVKEGEEECPNSMI